MLIGMNLRWRRPCTVSVRSCERASQQSLARTSSVTLVQERFSEFRHTGSKGMCSSLLTENGEPHHGKKLHSRQVGAHPYRDRKDMRRDRMLGHEV